MKRDAKETNPKENGQKQKGSLTVTSSGEPQEPDFCPRCTLQTTFTGFTEVFPDVHSSFRPRAGGRAAMLQPHWSVVSPPTALLAWGSVSTTLGVNRSHEKNQVTTSTNAGNKWHKIKQPFLTQSKIGQFLYLIAKASIKLSGETFHSAFKFHKQNKSALTITQCSGSKIQHHQ